MQQRGNSALGYVAPGIVAGLVAGIAIAAFLIPVDVNVLHETTLTGFFRYIASGAIGTAAAQSSSTSVWLGLVMHFVIAAMWGVGYSYIAARTPQIAQRPLVSGLVFGFVVYFIMQLVEVVPGIYHLPTATTLLIDLAGHCFFFGLPVAYVLKALGARPSGSSTPKNSRPVTS